MPSGCQPSRTLYWLRPPLVLFHLVLLKILRDDALATNRDASQSLDIESMPVRLQSAGMLLQQPARQRRLAHAVGAALHRRQQLAPQRGRRRKRGTSRCRTRHCRRCACRRRRPCLRVGPAQLRLEGRHCLPQERVVHQQQLLRHHRCKLTGAWISAAAAEGEHATYANCQGRTTPPGPSGDGGSSNGEWRTCTLSRSTA